MIILTKSKFKLRLIISIILFFLLISGYPSVADSNHWDNNWSYSQEIIIPFDTSLDIAHFQPIDIKIDFNNPCWAKRNGFFDRFADIHFS